MNKISIKLIAIFGVIMLLFSLILGGVFLMLFRSHTVEINRIGMEEKAVSIAETISSFQQNSMGGHGAYLRFLDGLATEEVWIVDENLNIFSRRQDMRTMKHSKHTISHTDLPKNAEEIVLEVFSGKTTYGEEFSGILGVSSLTVGAPIIIKGNVAGAVLVHSPVSGITRAVSQGLMTVFLSCAVALVVAGIVAAFFSYKLTRPLSQMKNVALSLAEGDYEVQTNVVSRDEIGQLARALDSLSLQLKKAEAERESLIQMREDFVTNISHELRTPVAVLRGSLELLQDGTVNSPEERSEFYRQMLSESRHLERLVNDLLEISRLQDAGFSLAMEKINLCDVIKDAVRAIRYSAQNKQISVIESLPEKECIMEGDYGRLRQLLVILLDNGVKFSESGENVELRLQCEDGYKITVTDHGSGIAADDIPYIFDRFHKSDKDGTGLGLAIAEEIVKRHKGNILVESGNAGTTFKIYFPRKTHDS